MRTALRSNFPVGSPQWAKRRAQWLALGLSDEDLQKPKIAVVNSSSDLAICYAHLDQVAAQAKAAIRAAGGLPLEIRTVAPSDLITSAGHKGGYILSARDLIVNDIEAAVEGALLDGMLCLSSCDKTVPAHLMAAARLNIPTVVVACGYQPSGRYRGRPIDVEDIMVGAGHLATGRLTVEEMWEMSACAITGPGVCAGMGTANSMHIVSEALGMAMPKSTPVQALSSRMWEAVESAGRRVVEMVWEDLTPRRILTPAAFANAVRVVLAISGSINCIKHLQAIAREAECEVDVYELFRRLADQIPVLVAVRPNGEHRIEDFEAAGGAIGLMKQLEPQLEGQAMTVTGRRLGELLQDVEVPDSQVIRPLGRPYARRPSLVLVSGSLAPHSAIIKLSPTEERATRFEGPAIVYESLAEAVAGVQRGEVKPGHVVVLRGLGPKGTPGMGVSSALVFAVEGAGLSAEVAIVTDGQLSGLVNRGIVVGEVSPEAADGGPIGLVENGDRIAIDIEQRRVDLAVPEEELRRRQQRLDLAGATSEERGWLAIYRRIVRPLSDGAVLDRG